MTQQTASPEASKAIRPLEALNFFMADMQAGIGPFLGVFLLAYGWHSGLIGSVMTIGGVAGMAMTAPAGALVDATSRKRLYVIVPGVCTVLASMIILVSQSFWLVALSQVATAIAGAAIGPAVVGMTLGIVRQAGFNRQNGRNQAFNHAGNMVGAALSGFLGWKFGLTAVFWLAAVFRVLSIISVLLIPAGAIDDKEARGLKQGRDDGKASGFRVLLECKPLLILAAALACFHLGNGAMLPLYGMALAATKQGDPATFVALTIVVAQAVMIVASILAMRMAEKEGYWLVLLISFIALPDPRRPRRLFHQPVGRLSGTGARRNWSRAAERSRSRPRRANPQWHRPDQCWSGGCDDGPRLGRIAESGDRRLDRTRSGLQPDVLDPWRLRACFDRSLGRLRRGAQTSLRIGNDRHAGNARGSLSMSGTPLTIALAGRAASFNPERTP